MSNRLEYFQTAINFAATWHAEQKRKYTGLPYLTHLVDVACLCSQVGLDSSTVQAALLHDVLEDTEATYDEVRSHFGVVVADRVLALTDCGKSVGNRAARKAVDRARLASSPFEVQSIKLADLIDNTRSIVQFDPDFAKVYLKEKRALLDVLDGGHPILREHAELAWRDASAARVVASA